MLDDKIESYRRDITIAKKLAQSELEDKEYYQMIASKLEKMLNFYQNLKLLRNNTEN